MDEYVKSFKDLNVWKLSHCLVLKIYFFTDSYPKIEMFGLVNQMRRAVVSVTSNIAEGYGRRSYKEKIRFYYIAKGSLTELQNQVVISKDLNYLSPDKYIELDVLILNTIKVLAGLIRSSSKYVDS